MGTMGTQSADLGRGDSAWFTRARFGLFIHWGLYAMGARHEWLKSRERMDDDAYAPYFRYFDPDLYDPAEWAERAWQAGMRYVVVTTKHHEGFCLWDSKLTDYKAPNTPAGRDLLRPLVEAFRSRGFRIGFYYSLLDWHHPEYTIDGKHPLRDDPAAIDAAVGRNIERYVEYLFGQTRELLTEYGPVDILWYDFPVPAEGRFAAKDAETFHSEELIRMIRSLAPHILLNDRLGIVQDITTPEQVQPDRAPTRDGRPVVWEACHTFSGSWGYHRDEASWKPSEMLLKMLIDTVSKGGNFLLNVGPTARGTWDPRATERLSEIGEWMRLNGRAIYGASAPPDGIRAPSGTRMTFNPETGRLYVHLFDWPFRYLHLPGLGGRVAYAQLLHDASEVRIRRFRPATGDAPGLYRLAPEDDVLTLELPVVQPPVAVPVIECFLTE